ncbi:MAG: TrmH family RNA methyltransferase [Bacteroidales bacterium]
MLSQNQVKHIVSLKTKKFREEHNQFIAEGHKLVLDLVHGEFDIAGIYASADWIVSNLSLISGKRISAFETLPREMERISALSTPSPVLAVVNIPHTVKAASLVKRFAGALTLALDDIRDPGNLGTIIRIADWFGISTILCSENCVDTFNPKVVQATMGSIARVKMVRCNLAETLAALSETTDSDEANVPVYGTFLEGDPVYSQALTPNGIIVIGNESRGISSNLVPFINRKIFIPSFGSSDAGKAESLNASIATAIICSEFRRNSLREHGNSDPVAS